MPVERSCAAAIACFATFAHGQSAVGIYGIADLGVRHTSGLDASNAPTSSNTDSMGSEMHDLCQECLDKAGAAARADASGTCDWCKAQATDLRNHRDWEEGSSGPVYRVCGACRTRESENLAADIDDHSFGWD